jgi:molybdopterin converting factor, subunit 1, non-archaeal
MRIRYFAWIKDITKKDDDIIDINHPKNIQELKIYLENIYPELKKHFSQDILRFAVNQEYVSENLSLKPIDEIAIFPPVSGG